VLYLHKRDILQLGRGEIDALALMKVSKKQDCVIRGRIEDFRAHHRLQLASGIIASTVESEDARSSTTGRRSSESRSEPRLRIFGRNKKQGIFRHMDRIPPRLARYVKADELSAPNHETLICVNLCRTFDRNITDEYTETLRRDHPTFAEYYEGMAPQVRTIA